MSGFQRACALSQLPDQGALGVEVAGVPVAIVRT
jgi:hypothetical protein